MVRRQKFYQITTHDREADINIYGDITGDAELINAIFHEDLGDVSARGIVKEIADLDVDTINVYINSYGGEVAEAVAIYSALKRHPAAIHTFCDGFACSAATIIFCAGDVRTMGSIAVMMIHNCMSYLGYANSNEMRKAAEDNDKINQSSINAYLATTNLSEDMIRELMDNATWMTAEECLKYGFATDIADMTEDEDEEAQQRIQSAFPVLRAAVLRQQQEDYFMKEISKKLDQLIASQHEEVNLEPELVPADPEPEVVPEEESEEDPEPEQKTGNKFSNIFSLFMTKEEE